MRMKKPEKKVEAEPEPQPPPLPLFVRRKQIKHIVPELWEGEETEATEVRGRPHGIGAGGVFALIPPTDPEEQEELKTALQSGTPHAIYKKQWEKRKAGRKKLKE